jgi:hypothetical protein
MKIRPSNRQIRSRIDFVWFNFTINRVVFPVSVVVFISGGVIVVFAVGVAAGGRALLLPATARARAGMLVVS